MDFITLRTTENNPFTYRDLDLFQKQKAQQVLQEAHSGTFILAEVEPVITVGRRSSQDHFLHPIEFYAAHGVDIYPVDRGGLLTYHGPGQWVFFLVENLERLTGDSRGVKKAVCLLLKLLASFLKDHYGFETVILEDEKWGLWTLQSPAGSQKKIASIGVSVPGGVLQHGVSINVYRTPQSFLGIKPCGLDSEYAYLCEELRIDPKFQDSFFTQFGNELTRYVSAFFKKN